MLSPPWSLNTSHSALIAADWYEERDDPDTATFLRNPVDRMDRLSASDGYWSGSRSWSRFGSEPMSQ